MIVGMKRKIRNTGVGLAGLLMVLFACSAPAQAVTNKISANFSSGSMLVGPNSNTCNTTIQGAVRFMSSGPSLAVCDGVNSGWTSLSGGSGSAAGSNTQVQFNSGGSALGASANFTWDNTNSILSVANSGTGAIRAGNGTVSTPSHSFSAGAGGAFMAMSNSLDSSSTFDITSVGATDWAIWGNSSGTPVQRKSGGGSTIGNASIYLSGSWLGTSSGIAKQFTWTGGTPTASGNTSNETQNPGSSFPHGITITFPADTSVREARVYWSYGGTAPRVTAIISDGSTANIVESGFITTTSNQEVTGVVSVTYAALSASKTLTLRFEALSDNTGGSMQPFVAIQAATVRTLTATDGSTTGMFMKASGAALDFAVGGVEPLQLANVASAVNYFKITPGAAGNPPSLGNTGSDTSGAGLGINLTARSASVTGAGGAINFTGGTGAVSTGDSGAVSMTAGTGGATGAGGALNLTAANGGSTSGNGGSITLAGGSATATGTKGGVINMIGTTPYMTIQPPETTSASIVFNGSDALTLPSGTTGNRPSSPVNGMLRYNTTTTKLEGYQASAWTNLVSTTGSGTIDGLTDGMTNWTTTGSSSSSIYLINSPTTIPGGGGGDSHTIIGAGASRYLNTSSQLHEQTAFGALAMSSSSTSNYNTAFGSKAMCCYAKVNGNDSSQAFGYNAGRVFKGANLWALGANALMNTVEYTDTGDYSNHIVGFGYNAGKNITTMERGNYMGSRAGEGATTAGDESLVFGALSNITSNTGGITLIGAGIDPRGDANGGYGGQHVITGAFAFSSGSLGSGTSGFNIGAGARAGFGCTDCNYNWYFGYQAGYTTTTGTDNILFGANVTASSPTASSEISFGNLIRGDRYASGSLKIDVKQHINYQGMGPSASTCGTTPSVNGNDSTFKVNTGTGARTTCTITFGLAWTSTPVCQVTSGATATASVYISTLSSTQMILTYPSAQSQAFYVLCRGYL